jgi:hypothetical protein
MRFASLSWPIHPKLPPTKSLHPAEGCASRNIFPYKSLQSRRKLRELRSTEKPGQDEIRSLLLDESSPKSDRSIRGNSWEPTMIDDLNHDHAPGTVRNTRGLFHEQMLSLAQAARLLPALRGGRSPHPNTLFRWAKIGRKSRSGVRIRLEIWLIGGSNCTSTEALLRFFDRLNDGEVVPPPSPLPERDHAFRQQASQAKEILRRRGLIG